MAKSSDGFVIICVVLLMLVHNGACLMPMHSFIGDVESCESVCLTAFTESKASNQKICQRGCRLMSMIGFMGYHSSSSEELRDSCYKSCKEAYSDSESEGACAFGCQTQLPMTEARRKQMSSLYEGHMMSSPWSGMHSYGQRMMDCLKDYVSHQVRYGWYVYSPSVGNDDSSAGGGNQLTIILSASGSGSIQSENDGNSEDSIVVEQKTSNYLETNIASVDRAATPNVKSSQVESFILAADGNGVDNGLASVVDSGRHGDRAAGRGGADDWFFCLEKKAGTSRKVMVTVFIVSLLIIIYICASSSNSPVQTVVKKSSVYGDLEYLTQLDDKEFLVKVTPQDARDEAPALPVKIPVHVV